MKPHAKPEPDAPLSDAEFARGLAAMRARKARAATGLSQEAFAERYAYPVDLCEDEDGRVVARVPDLTGCVTDGADREEALHEASDALDAAIAATLRAGEPVPAPSPARGRPLVAASPTMAAKAALHAGLAASGLTRIALAERLGLPESEVRRMLDPWHPTKIERLRQALAALGYRINVEVTAV